MNQLRYIANYPQNLQEQIRDLIAAGKLAEYLLNRYPDTHDVKTDKALYAYVYDLKEAFMRKAQPLSKIVYDGKIHVINNALGTHTYAARIQGAKVKMKNEIRIATMFKNTPEAFLRMIAVHELAHLKEKAHDKAFYKLCTHMEPHYHQLEFDVRLYLTQLETGGKIY